MLCSCPKLVAFSGELESSAQVLTLQQHLTACAPSLRHMLLAAKVSMLGLEDAIAAIGPIISSLSQLRSVNICLQHCPFSNGIPDNKQVWILTGHQPDLLCQGLRHTMEVWTAHCFPLRLHGA